MDAATFIGIVRDCFEYWLKLAVLDIAQGRIVLNEPHSWPTGLRIAESPTHFVAELMGAEGMPPANEYRLVAPRIPEQVPTTTDFFSPGFPIVSACHLNVKRFGPPILICTYYDKEAFVKKVNFPVPGGRVVCPNGFPTLVDPAADDVVFEDATLIRADDYRIMFRYVSAATVFAKSYDKTRIINFLADLYAKNSLFGLTIGEEGRNTFARQLLSLADQDIDEKILDRFIQAHPDAFARALGYVKALPQRTLSWVERPQTLDPAESIPDYLLERADGYYDILDLKRGLLARSLVKGKLGRRRFCDYASALIAQLDVYGHYFASQKNAQWALNKYGVKVKNPRLIGVVGNYDSFDNSEVPQVLRQFRENLVLMSYANVVDLLRARESRRPSSGITGTDYAFEQSHDAIQALIPDRLIDAQQRRGRGGIGRP